MGGKAANVFLGGASVIYERVANLGYKLGCMLGRLLDVDQSKRIELLLVY